MASIIRIKRSSTSGNPGTLGAGELAYSALTDNGSNGGDRLYIGMGTETGFGNAANHVVIGGKYFTDMMDHNRGTLTANSALLVDANSKLDNLKVDNLDFNDNTISSTNSNGNIVLDPNGTGYVSIVGTNGVVIPVGTEAQRGPSVQGTIRYNTDSSSFEGYSGTNWGSLGGVKSVDGLTYITAESSPGSSDDTIRAYTNDSLALQIDTNSAQFESKIANVNIAATTTSTDSTTGALTIVGGVGIGGDLNIAGDLSADNFIAGSTNLGNISITGNTISSTNGDINLTPNGTGKTVVTNLYIGADTITEFIQDITGGQLGAGEGIDVTYDDVNGTTTIDAELATTINRGVASFADADFNVTSGAVELKDTVVKSITTDSGALTPSSHALSILGGEGVDVTHSNNTITVAGEDATTTNKGVASFADANFTVSSGAVTAKNITLGSSTLSLGSTTTSIAGITELAVDDLNFNGNEISSTNSNGNISLNPNGTGTVDVNGARISGLGIPTQDTDAATKLYVDTVAEGLSVKPAVRAASTANITATYNNGTNGVGATLTIAATATLTIDGVNSWTVGDGILVKNQTSAFQNGRYYVSTVGNISAAWVLTRCSKCDEPTEIPSMYVFVQEGTTYASTGWVATVEDFADFDVGVDDITFTQFSGAGTYLAGNGLTITGSTFNVVGTADRITANADSVDIASTYVGQSSITTLGTIGSGTWEGSVVGPTYGGTGVDNGTKTITLGGNFTHTGAHTLGLTTTAATSVTLPTTGTLATRNGAETFTNKSLSDSTTFFIDNADATKKMQFQLSGLTASTTRVLTVPNYDGTIATLAGDEALTNKSISNSSFAGSVAASSLSASNAVTFTDTTDASPLGTAAVVMSGGLSVAKKIYVGDDIIGSGPGTFDVPVSVIDGFQIDGGIY